MVKTQEGNYANVKSTKIHIVISLKIVFCNNDCQLSGEIMSKVQSCGIPILRVAFHFYVYNLRRQTFKKNFDFIEMRSIFPPFEISHTCAV